MAASQVNIILICVTLILTRTKTIEQTCSDLETSCSQGALVVTVLRAPVGSSGYIHGECIE